MGEQEQATDEQVSECPHPKAVGKRWGDPISEGRQSELSRLAVMQLHWLHQPEAKRPDSPLYDAGLTGADIFWLSQHTKSKELHLEGAFLQSAHLEGAGLFRAHLEGATLDFAHLEGANLTGAHLEGTDLVGAHLEGADLSEAELDENTSFHDALLGPGAFSDWFDQLRSINRNVAFMDIKWHGANLTVIPWNEMRRLGDERHKVDGMHRDIARTYRLVAMQLRSQGISETADQFAYRAQIWQGKAYLRGIRDDWRRPWRWLGDANRYIGSLFLSVLAGYGYRPGRTVFWYILTVFGFMWGYLQVTHGVPLFGLTEPAGTHPLYWYEALVLSVASFHGRGFFPQDINLGDPVAILAASEAVIGLFVEISFIATFTQRYFAR